MEIGWQVAVGEVDGDPSTDELLLAGYGGLPGTTETIWVLDASGAAELDETDASCELSAASDGDEAAAELSPGADVDGDGHADLLIGAPGAGTGGIACLVLGPVTAKLTLSSADASFRGAAGADTGSGVSLAGDVDGDGTTEILVGAPGADSSYLCFGGSGLSGSLSASAADVILEGASAGDLSGSSVSTAGDVDGDGDGDGDDDVLVGAPGLGADAGGAHLLSSGPF